MEQIYHSSEAAQTFVQHCKVDLETNEEQDRLKPDIGAVRVHV